MEKIRTKMIVFAATVVVVFTACKKDDVMEPQRPGQEEVKNLEVTLNNSYLPAAKLDSAFAIWEVNGTTQKVKLQLSNNILSTSLAGFIIQAPVN